MDSCKRQAQEELQAEKVITPIYEGRLIKVDKQEYTTSLGSVVTDLVTHPGAVAIIPVLDDGRIVLIKQWRRAVQQILIEIPAGTLEEGEDPLLCGMRELQEETGYRAETLSSLGIFYTCPGFCTEKIHLFLACGLTVAPLSRDEHEVIEVMPVTKDALEQMIACGEIKDSKTLSAWMLYKAKNSEGIH